MFLVVLSFRIVEHQKVSEFLDHQLQLIMKQGNSYIKDTGDFLEKLRAIEEIPKGAILVTADVVGLYPSIPHDEGLEVLRNKYDKFIDKTVPTEDIIKMAEFVLKNNFFEFNLQTNIRDSDRYKFCSTVCLHFYGLHRDKVLKISGDKTLALEKVYR